MYLRWQTSAEEMKQINPNVKFLVVVDHVNDWYEEAETYEKAIEIARDLIESDGHHVLVRIDRWRGSHGMHHASTKMISMITWCDTQTGEKMSKTIKAIGITYGKISAWQKNQQSERG